MPATVASFKTKFPVERNSLLAEATDDQIQDAIDEAKEIFVRRESGTLYLAAHILTLTLHEKPNVGAGVLASEGMGPHSESYRAADAEHPRDPLYDTTSYGRSYLRVRRAATAARVSIV